MAQARTRTLVLPSPFRWAHGPHEPRRRVRAVALVAGLSVVLLAASFAVRSTQAEAAATTYSIWSSSVVPAVPADGDTASVELGVRFRSTTEGWVTAIRFYKSAQNRGTHTGTLWSSTGTPLARTTFAAETTSGWQQATLSTPVRLAKNTDYVASYHSPGGRYADDAGALSASRPKVTNALTATAGVYDYAGGFPTKVWDSSNYYVDVVFTTAGSNAAPVTSTRTAGSGTSTRPTTAPTTTSGTTTGPSTTTASPTSTATRPPASTTTTTPPTSPPTTTSPSAACKTAKVWSSLEACGWPGPANTGYPTGQVFSRTVTGGYVVTTDNAVIDGWKVSGGIQVRAKNVTIRNSWVTSSFGGAGGSGTVNINPGASATVEHNVLDGLNATHACIWHEGSSMTATANNCQGVNDGIFMWATQEGVDGTGDNFTIQDNWLHSFTTQAANGHIDGIQTEGTRNGVIRHNTIDVTQDQDSDVALWNSRKSTDNVKVDGNLMAGGGFSVYAEDYSPSESNPTGGYTVTNVSFTNNTFSTVHFGCVGVFGVWFTRGAPSDGWRRSGNIVLETGQNIDTQNPTVNGRLCT